MAAPICASFHLNILQVFTAAVFSFAHGSNDVANSIGPFATIYGIYKEGGVSSSAKVPVWILVVGKCHAFYYSPVADLVVDVSSALSVEHASCATLMHVCSERQSVHQGSSCRHNMPIYMACLHASLCICHVGVCCVWGWLWCLFNTRDVWRMLIIAYHPMMCIDKWAAHLNLCSCFCYRWCWYCAWHCHIWLQDHPCDWCQNGPSDFCPGICCRAWSCHRHSCCFTIRTSSLLHSGMFALFVFWQV